MNRYSDIPAAQDVIAVCKGHGLRHVVISPGSRNAPLSIGFSRCEEFKKYVINDERSAAFFALGLARQSGLPAILVCTSGSAVLNYYPAVSEAFYSHVPLLVLSADRPAEWIDQAAGQTIRQEGVLEKHTVYSAALKEGHDLQTRRHNSRLVNTAILEAEKSSRPVHLNIPFSEPLYGTTDKTGFIPRIIRETSPATEFSLPDRLGRIWENSSKRMILVGASLPDRASRDLLDKISADRNMVILTETISNTPGRNFISNIDRTILPLEEAEWDELRPDLLITLGGMVVSKKVKAFLQSEKIESHWHVNPFGDFPDTYQILSEKINARTADFLKSLADLPIKETPAGKSFAECWFGLSERHQERHRDFLKNRPFSDLKVWDSLTRAIPENIHLEISNSASIRYHQLFGAGENRPVFCNRGTSGIDGCTSTAIGAAIAGELPVTFLTGDTAFFYDSNALWNRYIPKNFRIILINNSGGGIFRIISRAEDSKELEELFEAPHPLTAEPLARMHGLSYLCAKDKDSLSEALKHFWDDSPRAAILEIFTDRTINDRILKDYWHFLRSGKP